MATATNDPKPNHVYLVDGSGFIFRAFHGLPPMTRRDGTPVNAVYGFCAMLMRLLEDTDADHIAIIFDAARKTFRNDIYPAYKAHRPDAPDELIPQFALVRDAVRAFNLPSVELADYEADDLIATYARQAEAEGAEVTIVSSDKDLMQLVRGRVSLFDPMKLKVIGVAEVIERFGVPPEKVVDVQALAGDASDNVPGVPGIGVKTAAQLIGEYGDLDTLLARAGEIKQPKRRESLVNFADQARISRELVRLKDDVPAPIPLAAFRVRAPDPGPLRAFFAEQEFRSLLQRLDGKIAKAGGVVPPTAARPKSPRTEAYELVTDAVALEAWIARAAEAGTVAVDTETTSLDPQQARLVGISLAVAPGQACYIPVGHGPSTGAGQTELGLDPAQCQPIKQLDPATALAILAPLLADPAVLKVGQNIKYDMAILARHGARVTPIDDTMLLSYVLDGSRHGHGMDELAKLWLDRDTIKFSDVAGSGKSRITFDRVPLDKALDYAAEDADVTLELHRHLKPRLVAEHMAEVYETMERPLIAVLAAMEAAGILVDPKVLRDLSRDFGERLAGLEQQIHALAGFAFNVGSPKQLGEVLFDKMGLAGGRKAKTGAYVTSADVLDDLAAMGHELPARVLDWRQLAKLKSTYSDALVEEINPTTKRVHTSYGMVGTSTGRLSSSDPNLQNIPVRTEEGRQIRRAFIADKGMVLLSVDYSQIELRLLAHVARIEPLKEAFHRGHDIHALTAAQVFAIPAEGMDPMVRRKAKAINFGIIYGISPFGLARQLSIPQDEARAYIAAYFERYPGIRAYMERAKAFAREHGFVTTIFGRRCWLPGIQDKNPARRAFMERAAINAPLQGAAADIIKRAMIRIPAALEKHRLKARMLLQVHDELLFEVPEAEVADTSAAVSAVMEAAARLDVPLTVDVGTGPNWADAH